VGLGLDVTLEGVAVDEMFPKKIAFEFYIYIELTKFELLPIVCNVTKGIYLFSVECFWILSYL
jgi:hypothetical protein